MRHTVRTDENASTNLMTSYPPITTNLDGTLSPCAAIQQCATLSGYDPGYYWDFDLHFQKSASQWVCVQYFERRYAANDGAFTVSDNDVGAAYGYCYGCN